MCEVEQMIKQNFEPDSDILDSNGEIRPEVTVLDSETGEHILGYKEPTEDDYKTAWEQNWEKLSQTEQERITRGDYVELKNCLKCRSRHQLVEHLRKQDRRRIVLLREHLLEIAAYNDSVAATVMEIVFICTRLMGADLSDLDKDDDLVILDDISDSDED
jgi:hypothetical protein